MTRIIEFLIAAAMVVVLFLVIALFLPAKRVVWHEIETNRPANTVYDVVNGFTISRNGTRCSAMTTK